MRDNQTKLISKDEDIISAKLKNTLSVSPVSSHETKSHLKLNSLLREELQLEMFCRDASQWCLRDEVALKGFALFFTELLDNVCLLIFS